MFYVVDNVIFYRGMLYITEIPIDDMDSFEEENNESDTDGMYAPTSQSDAILSQPGLLAGKLNIFSQVLYLCAFSL